MVITIANKVNAVAPSCTIYHARITSTIESTRIKAYLWPCVFIKLEQSHLKQNYTNADSMMATYNTIWDRFREKGPSAYYKICYKNALR